MTLPRVSPRGSKFLDTKAEQLRRCGFKRPVSGRNGVRVRGSNWFGGASVEAMWCSPVAPSNPGFPASRTRGAESAETPTTATEAPGCGPCTEPAQMWLRQWWSRGIAELSRREAEGVQPSGCSGLRGVDVGQPGQRELPQWWAVGKSGSPAR